MRTVIVDDEPLARTRLQGLLEGQQQGTVVAAVGDGEAALAVCAQQASDVLLADIDMPGMSGTALARRIAALPAPPQIVFCTAYEAFAAEAYAIGAADYLLKPIQPERLRTALDRARRLAASAPAASPALTIRRANAEHRITLESVFCLLADDKYVTVHHEGGEDLTDMSLRQLETSYPQQLVRLHRGCLVPRHRLTGLFNDNAGHTLAHLAGCPHTPDVSRRNLPRVRQLLREA